MVDRRVTVGEQGNETIRTLEFGVSGFLINSVVVFYDRTDQALWSQLLGEAISGPHVGTRLSVVNSAMLSWREFRDAYPNARIVGYADTGFPNMYSIKHYPGLDDDTIFYSPVPNMGDQLRPKQLGLGIRVGQRTIFVTKEAAMRQPIDVDTEFGTVRVMASEAGVYALDTPPGVFAAQTFYFGWSAFFPDTEIVE